jgi:hypothetical protein
MHCSQNMAELNITELPLDILVLVFPYLDAKSFLAFCSTCKAFQQRSIRLDSAYWSFQTRSKFQNSIIQFKEYDLQCTEGRFFGSVRSVVDVSRFTLHTLWISQQICS